MEKDEILKKLNGIFINILDDEDIVLKNDTTAKDIDDWDSLNHMQLVYAIEKSFKINFSASEILNWKNVGDMIDSIHKKL
ncbi:acyl carrier protein [Mucilaginibacter frigoritolerans]|uniref:Acyl carrier protein n=1 Tax=Mucilaginibacter frigoritolerans TaxID=652788 RepID=A0A562U7V3_9SPHI|nr:acyl carrier protein [Mucilaginibacter frigoritolerans]TWJ01709.1 acyl carrier protein [Mucilaginibacter frigoritolerans]